GSSMSKTHAETRLQVERSLKRRYWAERRFRFYGLCAVLMGVAAVLVLFGTIFGRGMSAFRQAEITLDIHYDPAVIDPQGTRDDDVLATADYNVLIRNALREGFPEVEGRANLRQLYALVSTAAPFRLQHRVQDDPSLIGTRERVTFRARADVDQLLKGH